MLKQGYFIKNKYYKFFAGSMLGCIANGINVALDSVLSGTMLGDTALTAVSIVAPLSFILSFFATIYAPGYGILYAKFNGEFDKENAYKIAGQSVLSTLIFSTLLATFLFFFKKPFLLSYGCMGELYVYASAYYNWIIVSSMLLPFSYTLYYLLAADADTLLMSAGGISSIVSNVIFSSVLCKLYGVSGLGMGSAICIIVCIAVYSIHWFRKTNSIHFKFSFNIKYFLISVKLSGATACSYLFAGLTDIIMNKVILISCGVSMIAAYSVINLIYSFYECFGAPYSAASGLAATFMGEKNNEGVKNVMKTAIKATIGLGLFMAALLFILAPQLPKLYGIDSLDICKASTNAARWMTLAAVPYGIAYVMECCYPTFGKSGLGIAMSFLNDIFCPLAFSIPLSFIFGFKGVSIGMAVNAYFVLGLFALFVIIKYGRKDFPLYLTDFDEKTVSFDLRVTPESIVEIRDSVSKELKRNGYEIDNVELLTEELFTRIYEKNPGKSVLAECVLLFGKDYVRIIVRDDGAVFNFVDANNEVESINAHTLNSLLERVPDKEYMLTTSFNRNGFVFRK